MAVLHARGKSKAVKRGFTLVELLVVITIIGMLVSLLLPAIQSAREAGRRNTCSNNMRQCGLALMNFEGNRKNFPGYANAIANKRASWVVPILPYLERNDLYQIWQNTPGITLAALTGYSPTAQQGTVLNAGSNQSNPWAYTELAIVECPSNPAINTTNNPLHFVVNSGSARTASDNAAVGSSVLQPWPEDANSGVFFNQYKSDETNGVNPCPTSYGGGGAKTSIDFIGNNDGTSNTIMMSENLQAANWATDPAYNDPGSQILPPWKSDFQLKQYTSFVWFIGGTQNNADPPKTTAANGFNQASKLINTQTAGVEMPLKDIHGMGTPGGLDYSRPSSQHPGGVNMVFCDGHLRFMIDEIPYHVYTQLMTPRSKAVIVDRDTSTTPPTNITTSAKAGASSKVDTNWNYILSEADVP